MWESKKLADAYMAVVSEGRGPSRTVLQKLVELNFTPADYGAKERFSKSYNGNTLNIKFSGDQIDSCWVGGRGGFNGPAFCEGMSLREAAREVEDMYDSHSHPGMASLGFAPVEDFKKLACEAKFTDLSAKSKKLQMSNGTALDIMRTVDNCAIWFIDGKSSSGLPRAMKSLASSETVEDAVDKAVKKIRALKFSRDPRDRRFKEAAREASNVLRGLLEDGKEGLVFEAVEIAAKKVLSNGTSIDLSQDEDGTWSMWFNEKSTLACGLPGGAEVLAFKKKDRADVLPEALQSLRALKEREDRFGFDKNFKEVIDEAFEAVYDIFGAYKPGK